ncbi:MAG: Ig-like domain-containing protein, partial [Ilumatobacteraceae bacterium]
MLTAVVIVVSFDGGEKAPTSGQPQVASEPPLTGDAAAPSGEPMPVGNLPGWRQIFTDDFTTAVPLGRFPDDVATKWGAYSTGWPDTTGYGTQSPLKVDSIANGMLTQHIHTENGVAMVSALQPKLTPTSPYGGTYGRYALRFRTDPIDGYKMAWLLWPDLGNQPLHGELDFPETNLDSSSMWAFVHRTNSLGGDDQASWNPPANLSDWHTAVIAWSPNLVVFTLDGVELGRTSERVPSTSMHWVLQTETAMELTAPPPADAAGDVQIDWVAAWAYDSTTADTEDPVVTVTTPTAGSTVGGSALVVRATATDNKGVLGVQFELDGQDLGPEVTTAPYAAVWNTKLVPDGMHTLTAIGRDDAGNMGTSVAVSVKVDNPPDTTRPTFTTNPCLDGCTAFPLDKANVLVSFDEAVVGVSGTSFTLKNQDTGAMVTAVVSYEATANTVIASLDPVGLLQPRTHYTATLTSAIRDVSLNPIATTSWTFTTGPRPTATFTPADGATAIDRATTVTATFDEAITGTTGNFTLKTSSGTAVPTTMTYDQSTLTATLVPSAALDANTRYTAALNANIKDAVYNALDPTSWSFTTNSAAVIIDKDPPKFTTIPCQAGCTRFPVDGTNVQVSFDEQAVGVNSGSFWLKNTNTGQVVPSAVT